MNLKMFGDDGELNWKTNKVQSYDPFKEDSWSCEIGTTLGDLAANGCHDLFDRIAHRAWRGLFRATATDLFPIIQ